VPAAWPSLKDEIADEIQLHGWSEHARTFTAAYDGTDLDASVLAIARTRFLDATDHRLTETVRAVERELRRGSTVFRYHHDDGLAGDEGGFTLMTSWLIDALAVIGAEDDANSLFAALLGHVGATGLLAEEVDPETGRGLGNHPQAYSHLGLVQNALTLAGSASADAGIGQ
jgi:GH15 family glucan-1,4-alpha-glucosidase